MENKKLKLDFEMQIQEVKDIDDSLFARAKVIVAYCGRNRNYSDISQEVFMNSPIANIPVVARYDAEKDDFGGHDMRVVTNKDGDMDIVRATIPFGFVPGDAEQWFEEAIVDGEVKTCFCTDVILWKQQYGYQRIAQAKSINQSMEIDVSDYTIDEDDYCIINKMKFEALTLLGDDVEPCFENAKLTLYSKADTFEQDYQMMLDQYKAYSLKLRNGVNKMEDEKIVTTEVTETPETVEEPVIEDVVEEPIVEEEPITEDVAPAVEEAPVEIPEPVEENALVEIEEPVQDYESMYNSVLAELEELREYKANVEKEKRTAAENEVFAKFDAKLENIDDYANLKANCAEYSIDQIEEKCYAIVGRYGINMIDKAEPVNEENESMRFSVIPEVKKTASVYGDLFEKYGNK